MVFSFPIFIQVWLASWEDEISFKGDIVSYYTVLHRKKMTSAKMQHWITLLAGKMMQKIPTINLWIKKWTAVFVALMSGNIPKLNKEVPVSITLDAIRWTPWTTVSNMLQKWEIMLVWEYILKIKTKEIRPRVTYFNTNCTPYCLGWSSHSRTFQ